MIKKNLKLLLKQIIYKYPCYTLIPDPDKTVLKSLYNQYQDKQSVESILIVPQGKYKVFRFIFDNSTPKTLGINSLLNNKSKQEKEKQKFIRECRNIIQSQIKSYYKKQIESGKVAPTKEKLAVDHVYPFSKLLEDFCLKNKISMREISSKDKNYKQIIEDFAKFHREEAVLQLLPTSLNLKKGNKL